MSERRDDVKVNLNDRAIGLPLSYELEPVLKIVLSLAKTLDARVIFT